MIKANLSEQLKISIHAPARGATEALVPIFRDKVFQSTRPRGARPASVGARRSPRHFNPRAREGRDGVPGGAPRGQRNFNPRAREGRDCAARLAKPHVEISIHAPARGATGAVYDEERQAHISIHAPARGATCPS